MDESVQKEIKEVVSDFQMLAYHEAEMVRLREKVKPFRDLPLFNLARTTAASPWEPKKSHHIMALEILHEFGPLPIAAIRRRMYERGFTTTSDSPQDVISQAMVTLRKQYLALKDKTQGVYRLMTEEEKSAFMEEDRQKAAKNAKSKAKKPS